jgi:hypothetical protein
VANHFRFTSVPSILGKTSDFFSNHAFSDEARSLLIAWVVHGCRREAFDPFPGRPLHVRTLLDGLQVSPRQPYLRDAPANVGFGRLATAFMNGPAHPMPGPSMKGDAAMTQATIALVFLVVLVGIMLWIIGVIALDILHDSRRTREKRQEPAAPEQHLGYGPHQAHHSSHRG